MPIRGASGEVLGCYGRKIRDDLRAGTPDHLYLPGPHRGLLNCEAFTASPEIVLCEAPIDALSAWRHGFRNVTTTWGAEGFTDDHLDAFVSHGTERCLIAFDRDEAGDNGAAEGRQAPGRGRRCVLPGALPEGDGPQRRRREDASGGEDARGLLPER